MNILKFMEKIIRNVNRKHETASFKNFSYGEVDRGSSIRIPRFTERVARLSRR